MTFCILIIVLWMFFSFIFQAISSWQQSRLVQLLLAVMPCFDVEVGRGFCVVCALNLQLLLLLCYMCIWVHCVCPGPWPFNLFFPVVLSLFWLGWSFTALIIWSVKTCAGPAMSSFPQCPCRSRSSVSVSCYLGTNASDSEESLHFFLVGVNKSYVIATADLWLMLPTCFPHSPPRYPA